MPEVQDAGGRGSSRVFSARNFLELAVALRLREMMLPVTATGAIVHVMRAVEDRLRDELAEFSLVTSLTGADAPDLRVIISDGHRIFFSLARGSKAAKLFGGVSIEELSTDGKYPMPVALPGSGISPTRVRPKATPTNGEVASTSIGIVDAQAGTHGFGGPEGSNFARSEISLTAVAKALPIA